jgi:hypothetical protein
MNFNMKFDTQFPSDLQLHGETSISPVSSASITGFSFTVQTLTSKLNTVHKPCLPDYTADETQCLPGSSSPMQLYTAQRTISPFLAASLIPPLRFSFRLRNFLHGNSRLKIKTNLYARVPTGGRGETNIRCPGFLVKKQNLKKKTKKSTKY